jgi:molybdate transport system substrate-binding protein
MGVFVKKGVAKPDVSSVEAFRRTFLNARSVSVPVGTGGPVSEYSIRLFERLGIAEVIKAKNVAVDLGTEYPLAVARGDAEVGLTQMSVILATEGVDLAGPVPDEIQNYTIYVVAVSKNSKAPEAVQSFVAFLTSPKVRAVLKSKGLE